MLSDLFCRLILGFKELSLVSVIIMISDSSVLEIVKFSEFKDMFNSFVDIGLNLLISEGASE